MQLRRAVSAGRYAPIPTSYSPQLSRIIAQMLVVEPSRRLKALDIVEHEEVRRRRASHELAHPAALPDEVDDVELLATIKPPKNKFDVKQLSEQLSAMSAQVATARSDASAQREAAQPPRPVKNDLGSVFEESPATDARFDPVYAPRAAAAVAAPAYADPPSYAAAPAPSYVQLPAYAPPPAYVSPPLPQQPARADEELPAGWKKVRDVG
jgi:hypothetical protein